MPVSDDFHQFVLEQLGRIRPVTSKRMFGGYGLYVDGVFFGVIDDNRVFFRTGPGNVADYVALDCAPFQPIPRAKAMSYHELPGDVLESVAMLREWLSKALAEAMAAVVKKPKRTLKTASKKASGSGRASAAVSPRRRHRPAG
jgi:DNA transformation protein and related proteins